MSGMGYTPNLYKSFNFTCPVLCQYPISPASQADATIAHVNIQHTSAGQAPRDLEGQPGNGLPTGPAVA
jgi:hypothetical protein